MTITILGIIISAIVSTIFSDKIIDAFGIFLSRIDLPHQTKLEGDWKAIFTIKENEIISSYEERILIVKRLGTLYGYKIENVNSTVESKISRKTIRVRARIIDNRYLTGYWFNPNKNSRHHGSFQLLVELSGKKMSGIWTGYSETKNKIHEGDWIWEKNTQR